MESRAWKVLSLLLTAALLYVVSNSSSRAPPPLPSPHLSPRASAQQADAVVRMRYEPSDFERAWRANVRTWADSACDVLRAQYLGETQAVITALHAYNVEPLGDARNREAFRDAFADLEERGLASHMVYELASGRAERVALEPLFGILRDPRTSCAGKMGRDDPWLPPLELPKWRMIQDKMVVLHDPLIAPIAALLAPVADPGAHEGRQQRRAFLFDLGGLTWSRTSAPGSRWIFRHLENIGIVFDHVFVWEAEPTKSADYFNNTRLGELGRVHFFNWPVNAVPGHNLNPLTMLRRVTGPEDFVAFKLDIVRRLALGHQRAPPHCLSVRAVWSLTRALHATPFPPTTSGCAQDREAAVRADYRGPRALLENRRVLL